MTMAFVPSGSPSLMITSSLASMVLVIAASTYAADALVVTATLHVEDTAAVTSAAQSVGVTIAVTVQP